ncbi:methionine--tRNA ligase [Roseivirga sp. UBA1976]|uniref:methionine--tRNA ligase n=1 Tax=Roseivirga sp. UBA1976 TaxID=1947386 RepID=UPI002580ACCF|nr:methionine--tRNA ligase [Roseivirga sp. UBA1976]MEC7755454.1 methionine--tRNA ligase [Bacteroidota bacterium]|tara:strand:- start:4999 stop:7059 length:2061 start_codon:yes stop_codon:yes gene_type:complete
MTKTDFKRHTVTAALPYANGPVHIGHLAGVYIPADIYVRYLRSKGEDVAFICGSDEHGMAITMRARKEGIDPQQIVDKYHGMIKKSFDQLGVSFDIYSRTSNSVHHETAQEFFKKLYKEGKFEERVSEQYFDEEAKQFLADRYITGTCPKCNHPSAYGDQCENCGTSLNPTDLINPKSTLTGNPPVLKETKHWYLPLQNYEKWLNQWIVEGHKNDWKPNVWGQCKSWIDGGLQPRAMTRDLDWGIQVPVQGADGKVLYVWFDAPIGYISATREWAAEKGIDWEPYWKDKDTKLVHFIGKDNIVFHCIIFPAILKAHGDYILPENVPANEFLNLENDKISTSRNWAVWLHEYLQELPGKQDVLRYALCANAPETKDNDFTWKDFQARNNSELVAILGNFVNRAVVLTHKYFEGKVPERGELFDIDREVLHALGQVPKKVGDSIERYRFREALAEMMDLARIGNKYLADTEPWKLIKTDEERVKSILNIALQLVANLAIVAEPFIPFSTAKLSDFLNLGQLDWSVAGSDDLLKAGHELKQPQLLFEKIEDKTIEEQIQKLENTKKQNQMENKEVEVAPLKETIVFDDFMKLDLRVGTILEAKRVEKSNKLLQFLVDTGVDKRTILSGIAKHYSPEEMIGKQVTIVANLAPRPMMGTVSEGMILMAEDAEGNLRLIQPNENVNPGSTVS